MHFNLRDRKSKLEFQIEVLHPISNESIPIKKLVELDQKCDVSSDEYRNLFLFKSDIELHQPHLVEMKLEKSKYGILLPIKQKLYGIMKVENKINSALSTLDQYEITSPEELISQCESLNLNPTLAISMTPPTSDSNDPKEFISVKYFQTLYQLKTPLNYFPKSCLIRFKNIITDKQEQIDILKQLILTIDQFDIRHTSLFSSNNKFERDQQGVFLTKYNLKDDTIDSELLSEIKIREGQLQIVLIFEILSLMSTNEEMFLSSNKDKHEKHLKKLEKQHFKQLMRKRKKKSVVPTFLGMGFNIEPQAKQRIDFNYDLYLTLNNLIDRLSLWDTLSKSNNTYGLMVYVLVPYYNKKLPLLMKYAIDNMKDSNMKLTIKRRNEEVEDEEEIPSQSTNSKFKKVSLKTQPPSLNRSTTLSEDYLPKMPSLKKSKSNLSSKNLSKRQVDLNVKEAKQTEATSSSFNPRNNVFTNAKRSKSMVTKNILATPSKPKSFSQIEATPHKNHNINIPRPKSFSQIEATPQRNHIIDLNSTISQIEATPQKSTFVKPNKKFEIEATPIKNNYTIINTPTQLISSSPSKKPKPGEPIQASPFYTMLTDDDNDDYDSDEIFKTRKITTYKK